MVYMQLALVSVNALPMSPLPLSVREEGNAVDKYERPLHRVTVVVTCILFAFLLALVQGYRAGRMAGQKSKTRVSDILVFVQGFVCTAFLLATAVAGAGLGLHTDKQCYNAIRICIAMYAVAKIPLYLFLLERIHLVRAPFVDRRRDPIYVVGAVLTTGGFIGIMSWQFVNPTAELSRKDGECRIGIQPGAAIAIIVLDSVINFVLTGVFVWQLQPAMASALPKLRSITSASNKEATSPVVGSSSCKKRVRDFIQGSSLSDVRLMMVRNVVGSGMILTVTLINNGLFLTRAFAKLGHACMLMCLGDVVFGMLVTQWLTMRSVVQEPSPSRPPSIPPHMFSFSDSRSNSANSGKPLISSTDRHIDAMMRGNDKPAPVSRTIVGTSRLNLR